MAGPIIMAGAPVAIDLLKKYAIPWLVTLADKLFGSKTPAKPDMGPTVKLPWVQQVVKALEDALVGLGAATPTDAATTAAEIQKIVDALNASGVLQGHATTIPPIVPPPFVPTIDGGVTPGIGSQSAASSNVSRILSILEGIARKEGVL